MRCLWVTLSLTQPTSLFFDCVCMNVENRSNRNTAILFMPFFPAYFFCCLLEKISFLSNELTFFLEAIGMSYPDGQPYYAFSWVFVELVSFLVAIYLYKTNPHNLMVKAYKNLFGRYKLLAILALLAFLATPFLVDYSRGELTTADTLILMSVEDYFSRFVLFFCFYITCILIFLYFLCILGFRGGDE